MRTQSPDTHPKIEAMQFEMFRKAGVTGRIAMMLSMIATSRQIQREGLRIRHPQFSDDELAWRAAALNYGEAFAARARAYRDSLGGEVSQQQWRDIPGVLKVQGNVLDVDHLRRWAVELETSDLLLRALQEAEVGG